MQLTHLGIGGFCKSYKPGLVAASNIALFFPIFLLTAEQAVTEPRASYFLDQFLVTLFAAASALFATVVLPRQSSRQKLDHLLGETVSTTCQILPLSLASVLDFTAASTPADSLQQQHLAKELRLLLPRLKGVHGDYCSEFVRTSLAPAALRPYIKALHRIQRNALLGPTSHVPGERIKAAMARTYERNSRPATPRAAESPDGRSTSRSPTNGLTEFDSPKYPQYPQYSGHARQRSSYMTGQLTASTHQVTESITHCLTASLATVRFASGWSSHDQDTASNLDLATCRNDLETSVYELQRRLSSMMDELSPSVSVSPSAVSPHHPSTKDRDRWRVAFYVVALIDLAKDVDLLLGTTIRLRADAVGTPRLFLPFTSGNKSKNHPPVEPLSNGLEDDPLPTSSATPEKHLEDLDFVTATLYQARFAPEPDSWTGRVEHLWRHVWDQKAVLRRTFSPFVSLRACCRVLSSHEMSPVRVMLSHFIHHLKHSRHNQFALKMSVGVTLLSVPALLPPGSAGREWFRTSRGAWMVVSYMYVLEVHTGAILKIAVQRALGTFIGSVSAYVVSCPSHFDE